MVKTSYKHTVNVSAVWSFSTSYDPQTAAYEHPAKDNLVTKYSLEGE